MVIYGIVAGQGESARRTKTRATIARGRSVKKVRHSAAELPLQLILQLAFYLFCVCTRGRLQIVPYLAQLVAVVAVVIINDSVFRCPILATVCWSRYDVLVKLIGILHRKGGRALLVHPLPLLRRSSLPSSA